MQSGDIIDAFNALLRDENFAAAKTLLLEHCGETPTDTKMCYRLGICHLRLEEHDDAHRLFTLARERGPAMYQTHFWMARYHIATDNAAAALEEVSACRPFAQSDHELTLLYNAFMEAQALGRHKERFADHQQSQHDHHRQLEDELAAYFSGFPALDTPASLLETLRSFTSLDEITDFIRHKSAALKHNVPVFLEFYVETLQGPLTAGTEVKSLREFLTFSFEVFISARRFGRELASATAPLYSQLLGSKDCDLFTAMHIYQCLYGYYWMDAAELTDMSGFARAAAQPFAGYLNRTVPNTPDEPRAATRKKDPLLGLLVHYAVEDAGNATVPHILSLLEEHAAKGQSAIVYCVQSFDDLCTAKIRAMGHRVRAIDTYNSPEAIEKLYSNIREDRPDILLTEVSSSAAAYLFHRRSAPVQAWLEMGFPYWDSGALDWTFMAHKSWREDFSFPRHKCSPLRLRQSLGSINKAVNDKEVRAIRQEYPSGSKLLGCFTRFSKITDEFLKTSEGILAAHPDAQLLIAGAGWTGRVRQFILQSPQRAQFTLFDHNIDIQLYGRAIDVFLDTFPFPGGNSCREVMSFGVPVVSAMSKDWPLLISESRDPDLIANSTTEFQAIVARLLSDQKFYHEKQEFALEFIKAETDVAHTYGEVMSRLGTLWEQMAPA